MESAANLGYRGAIRAITRGTRVMSERENMRSGEGCDGRDPEIIALRDRGQPLLRELNQYKAGDGRHSEICGELFEQLGPGSIILTPFCCEWLITSCRSANNIMPITIFLPAFIASFFYSA